MFLVNIKEIQGRPRRFNNAGRSVRDVYEERINESGEWQIIITGQEDLRQLHQEGLEASKPINIMKRVELGDVGILTQMQGVFADMTDLPNNLIDAHNSLLSANDKFYSLPVEVRSLFNNSVDKFFQGLSSGETSAVIDDYMLSLKNNISTDKKAESEVVEK